MLGALWLSHGYAANANRFMLVAAGSAAGVLALWLLLAVLDAAPEVLLIAYERFRRNPPECCE